MGRMFGKDGIRGIAVTELTCELALQIGRAAAAVLSGKRDSKAKILIGKDLRSSSDTLEAALCAGICSAGADAELLGNVPAPAVAYLVREKEAQGGIMISGAHSDTEYSSVKIFSSYGHRISEEKEERIEQLILDFPGELLPIPRREYGRIYRCSDALDHYIAHVKSAVSGDLNGVKAAIDCGNGIVSLTAKRIFAELGAEIVLMGNTPDGTNINRDCGCTNMNAVMEFVTANGCDIGLSFDGSGERCLAADENGDLIDGDMILGICAGYMQEKGTLRNNSIVLTPANNLGLRQFAKSRGITALSASTGERSMIRRMLEDQCSIAGDPSGQLIFTNDAPSSDGQLTALHLLEILKASGSKASSLASVIEKMPQVMLSVRIDRRHREVWKNDRAITGLIDEFDEILGDEGRIVVRETGAEPAIRITVEGKDFATINTMALQVADTIMERLQNN